MPYKSDKQRKFFHSKGAVKAGITKKVVKEFDKASKGKKLQTKAKKSTGFNAKKYNSMRAKIFHLPKDY